MANQSKLKAWVRYDGTGRVISGGPIFQVNKPKVGNWKQIDANLCCNGNTPTTTTTTTNGGGGGVVTAYIKDYWSNKYLSCVSTTEGSLLFYSSSSQLGVGTMVYLDATLTNPVPDGYVILNAMNDSYIVFGGSLSNNSCSSSSVYPAATSQQSACAETGNNLYIIGDPSNDYVINANFIGSGYPIGTIVYIKYYTGISQVRPYLVTTAYTAEISGSATNC